MKLLFASDH